MKISRSSTLAKFFTHCPNEGSLEILQSGGFFDKKILSRELMATDIFREYLSDYHKLESSYGIPYALCEDIKLYAIDAIVVAAELGMDEKTTKAVAKIFSSFYLSVHYFDDHVEHKDKFLSKYRFSTKDDYLAQVGAAPFSFLITNAILINKYLEDPILDYTLEQRMSLAGLINQKLLSYTPYFTRERKQRLSVEEIITLKQRNVTGSATALVSNLLAPLLKNQNTVKILEKCLYLLGSLTQITDDIRDADVDFTLKNANIVNTLINLYGEEKAFIKLADIYSEEEDRARKELSAAISKSGADVILSIPFYPFFINKSKLGG